MSKLVKSINGCTNYCGSNVYAGFLNTYHYIIKCDMQSSVFKISINISQKKEDNDTIKEIKKTNKDISININNNRLVITKQLNSKSELPELVNPLLEATTKILKENKYKEICKNCKENIKTYLIDNDGEINYYCDDCYKKILKEAKEKKELSLKAKEHIVLGIIGSLLFTIPGILVWLFLSYLNIEPALAAIVITTGSAIGYKKFAKNMKLTGLIISILIGLIVIFITHEINCSLYIYNLYKDTFNINLVDAYKSIPYYLKTIDEFRKNFSRELSSGYILSIIGIFTSFSLYRQSIYVYDIKKIGE